MLGETGWLIMSHRARLWRHTLPTKPVFRSLHHVACALVLWMTIVVPASVLLYHATLTHEHTNINIIGGSLHPEFDLNHQSYVVKAMDRSMGGLVMVCMSDKLLTRRVWIKCQKEVVEEEFTVPGIGVGGMTAWATSDRQHRIEKIIDTSNAGLCTVTTQSRGHHRIATYKIVVLALRDVLVTVEDASQPVPDVSLSLSTTSKTLLVPLKRDINTTSVTVLAGADFKRFLHVSATPVLEKPHDGCIETQSAGITNDQFSGKYRISTCTDIREYLEFTDYRFVLRFRLTSAYDRNHTKISSYTIKVEGSSIESDFVQVMENYNKYDMCFCQLARSRRCDLYRPENWKVHVPGECPNSEIIVIKRAAAIDQRDSILEEDFKRQPSDSNDTRLNKAHPTYLMLGGSRAGMSKASRWLTGRDLSDIAVSIYRGPAFNNSKRLDITWVNTQSLKREGEHAWDAKLWKETHLAVHKALCGDILPSDSVKDPEGVCDRVVDQLILVLDDDHGSDTDDLNGMVRLFRNTFGTDFYDHVVFFYTRYRASSIPAYDHSEGDTYRASSISAYARDARDKKHLIEQLMLKQEEELLRLYPELKPNMEEQISHIKVVMVDLNPLFLDSLPLGVPLTTPLQHLMEPLSFPAGVSRLEEWYFDSLKMMLDDGYKPLGLSPKRHPRMGPGLAQTVELTYVDFFHRNISVSGRGLGMNDRVAFVDESWHCGLNSEWGVNYYLIVTEPPAIVSQDGSTMTFANVNLQEFGNYIEARVCFCEEPLCDTDTPAAKRFTQDLGVIDVPTTTVTSTTVAI